MSKGHGFLDIEDKTLTTTDKTLIVSLLRLSCSLANIYVITLEVLSPKTYDNPMCFTCGHCGQTIDVCPSFLQCLGVPSLMSQQ